MTSERSVILGPLEEAVAFHLSIANTLALQTFLAMIGDHPRNARYIILLLIRINPGITQAELSRTNFRDKSSMSPVIREFVQTGIVAQSPIKIGGRPAQALTLTKAGEALCDQLQPFADAHSARILRILGPKKKAELVKLLRLLSDGLSHDPADRPNDRTGN